MSLKKFFSLLPVCLLLAAAVGAGFVFRGQLGYMATRVETDLFPCRQPITYSIGAFDKRFGISQAEFLSAIQEAAKVWEAQTDTRLFAAQPSGGELTVNLVYDERQTATDKLRKLGLVVKDDQQSYDALKARYDALKASEVGRKAALDARVIAFQSRQDAYEKEVAAWNARGGAPKPDYDRLAAEKAALNQEFQSIQADQAVFNSEIDSFNAMVLVLNRLAASLNVKVSQYNQIGSGNGNEFTEGNEQDTPNGQIITIYQFDDRQKLVRLLAHELGHALGLEHVDDPKAIMYRLNQGTNITPTPADLTELKNRCRIKG